MVVDTSGIYGTYACIRKRPEVAVGRVELGVTAVTEEHDVLGWRHLAIISQDEGRKGGKEGGPGREWVYSRSDTILVSVSSDV